MTSIINSIFLVISEEKKKKKGKTKQNKTLSFKSEAWEENGKNKVK